MNANDFGTDVGNELDWDSEIEKESDFILLSEGEYEFEVISFERARYTGGDKLPACNQAKLKLQITIPEGIATINHNLFLHSRCEGILSAFFNCIGQKKHGEKVKMDWGKVIGSKGRAKIGTRIYNEKTFNEVKRFLDPEETTQPQQPSALFKPGSF
jgi:hypothetical protein